MLDLDQIDNLVMQRRNSQLKDLVQKLARNDRETKYLKKWFQQLLKKEAEVLNEWHDSVRLYKYDDQISELNREQSNKETVKFNTYMEQYWPKVKQMAAFDLAKQLKSDPVKIKKSELSQLPPSALDNLQDCNLFETFFWDMLDIDVDREIKYQILLQIGQKKLRDAINKIEKTTQSK